MEVYLVAALEDGFVARVLDGAGERHDRVEQDAVLEVLLGARDDGEVDLDARLHRVEVVRRAAALRVGRARVCVHVVGLADGHGDASDRGAGDARREVDGTQALLLVCDGGRVERKPTLGPG